MMQNTPILKPNTNLSSNSHNFTQHSTPHYPPVSPIQQMKSENVWKLNKYKTYILHDTKFYFQNNFYLFSNTVVVKMHFHFSRNLLLSC